jgi:hypothetical protein
MAHGQQPYDHAPCIEKFDQAGNEYHKRDKSPGRVGSIRRAGPGRTVATESINNGGAEMTLYGEILRISVYLVPERCFSGN